MGVFTLYDDVIGNPCTMPLYSPAGSPSSSAPTSPDSKWRKCYEWHNDVRIVDTDSKVSKVGVYDDYGNVIVDGVEHVIYDEDKYLILDITYKYMKEHPKFKSLKSKLYEVITEYMKNHYKRRVLIYPCNKYENAQFLVINEFPSSMIEYDESNPTDGIDSWAYVNPRLTFTKAQIKNDSTSKRHYEESRRNSQRIFRIIDNMFTNTTLAVVEPSQSKSKQVEVEPSRTKSKQVEVEPKCTKRNPKPPCKDGYREKSNPKGAICCYKGKK